MPLTPEQEQEVILEFRRVRSPFKVANNLGFAVEDVWAVVDDNPEARATNVERFGGEGRPDVRQYIVGRIRGIDRWDNDEPAIAQARVDYEAGTHDMCQHRDGAWKFLLSIPLRRRGQARPDYFKPELQL